MIQIQNEEQFQQAIQSQQPVVVKFFADWCPDCKRMDMFLPSVLEELNTIQFFEIDRDAFPELAEQHEVMGIPSLLVFQEGNKLAHLHSANAKTPEEVKTFLSGYFQ
jgi:thioredoxin 1